MLDINLIRENSKVVEQGLAKRGVKIDFKKILKLDDLRRKYIAQSEELKAERNKFSKSKPDAQTIKRMKSLGRDIKDVDSNLLKAQSDLDKEMDRNLKFSWTAGDATMINLFVIPICCK